MTSWSYRGIWGLARAALLRWRGRVRVRWRWVSGGIVTSWSYRGIWGLARWALPRWRGKYWGLVGFITHRDNESGSVHPWTLRKMDSRRNKYTTAFKLRVIEAAENTNNCVAAREFGVNEKLVRDWRKLSHKLHHMPKRKCGTVHTIVFSYPILDFICTIEYYWWTSCLYCYRVKWI